jgi:hypothetical protein
MRRRRLPETDDRARAGGQLEVAGEEVGVHMGLDDPLDRQAAGRRLLQVHPNVAPGIDDHGPAGRLVTDEIGGLREARQVMLGEDHRCSQRLRPP